MFDDGLDGFAYMDELPLPHVAARRAVKAKPKPTRKGNPTARVRKAYASRGDDATFSRWIKTGKPHLPTQAQLLASPRAESPRLLRKPYVVDGRSKFSRRGIAHPRDLDHVLVSGHSNVKIGRDVRRGRFRGYWIYTLTLEERATCPRTCHHWATCYGNNMPYARRVDHRDRFDLQDAIRADVARLTAVRGRPGILVRLHALGDFFDPAYVAFWGDLLAEFPTLAAYGYTAWSPQSAVGAEIVATKAAFGARFAIRWSNGGEASDCTVPIRAVDEPVNATVCPEQTGKTRGCGTCGLCWTTQKNIAFIDH